MPISAKRIFSAGGLVYKKERKQILYLLRLPKDNPNYHAKIAWTLPKGWIDDSSDGKFPGPQASGKIKPTEEQIQTAAIKEVAEETGVLAKIIHKLATINYFFTDKDHKQILKFVTYYLMEYVQNTPEGHDTETETTAWLPYQKARSQLAYPKEKSLLDKAHEYLTRS